MKDQTPNLHQLSHLFSKEKAPPSKYYAAALYQGEWLSPHDGTAIAVRAHARALAHAGVPVLLKSFSTRFTKAGVVYDIATGIEIDPEALAESEGLHRTTCGGTFPLIKHLVVHSSDQLNQVIFAGFTRGGTDVQQMQAMRKLALRQTVLYTVWERDSIDEPTAKLMSRVAECWVPCEQNARMLRDSGIDRVFVIPHPYSPKDPLTRIINLAVPKTKKFYAIGRWEPRKGFSELIRAFCKAFPDGDETLFIKTNSAGWDGYPSPEESLALARAEGATESVLSRVTIKTNSVNRNGILRLHAENNVYVCSSHGEAWCLPAFEAKVAGNRLVHVGFGGTSDFQDPELDVEVPWTLAPVPEKHGYRWNEEAKWAEYEVEDLAEALKKVTIGARTRPALFEQEFSEEAVGAAMRERVKCMTEEAGAKFEELFREKS